MSKRGYVTQSQDDDRPTRTTMARPSRKKRFPKRSVKGKIAPTVRRIVDSMTETKETRLSFNPGGLRFYNGADWNLYNIFPITPYTGFITIAQGTGQGDRLGNEIRPISCKIRGRFWNLGHDATTNTSPQPIDVIMLVLRDKHAGADTLPGSLSALFQDGNTSISPGSNILDTVRPFNYDRYDVLAVRKKKVGFAGYNGTGASAGRQYFFNNDYDANPYVTVDCTKFYPKRIRYNDTGATPDLMGKGQIFVAFLVSRSNGETPTPGGVQRSVDCTMQVELKFKDA